MGAATAEGMKIPMVFLGSIMKESRRTPGKMYMLAKFQMAENNRVEVVSFYVPDQDVMNEISVLKRFTEYSVILSLSAFNEKPQVDLVGIGGEAS